jgi:hypothetical protein
LSISKLAAVAAWEDRLAEYLFEDAVSLWRRTRATSATVQLAVLLWTIFCFVILIPVWAVLVLVALLRLMGELTAHMVRRKY